MNTWVRLFLSTLCILITTTFCWGQLHLNITPLDGTTEWGVFVKPCEDISISGNTITGSGQVTISFPIGSAMTDLVSHAGSWTKNAVVEGPAESPATSYVSVGFISDSPQIIYQPGEETLLFSFTLVGNSSASAQPSIIDNSNDPFAQTPNSMSSNPGNDISVVDFGVSPAGFFYYSGNYDGGEVLCEAAPQDSTILEEPGNGTVTSTFDQIETDNYFVLSPNPTSEWIKMNFSETAANMSGTVRFWTASGIQLGQLEKRDQAEMSMNVGAMPSGIYYLSFESKGRVLQREAFLKQ